MSRASRRANRESARRANNAKEIKDSRRTNGVYFSNKSAAVDAVLNKRKVINVEEG